LAVFTSGSGVNPALRAALAARGLTSVMIEPMPLIQG
jgi:hypothetical protein